MKITTEVAKKLQFDLGSIANSIKDNSSPFHCHLALAMAMCRRWNSILELEDQYRWRDVKVELPPDCGVDLGDFIIMFNSGIDAISLSVYWCCKRKKFLHNGEVIDNNYVMGWMYTPRFEAKK